MNNNELGVTQEAEVVERWLIKLATMGVVTISGKGGALERVRTNNVYIK